MSVRTLVTVIALLTLSVGCSGRNTPNNPENEQWFCQSNEMGDGWECVQDANLAQVPVPTRMPPAPVPDPPAGFDDPLDLDALSAPLERNPNSPSAQSAETTGAGPSPDQGSPTVDITPPALGATSVSPAGSTTELPPESASSEIPRHVALAYVPAEPTQILQLPPDYYAVQMLAMNSPEEIIMYINDNNLKGMSGARVEAEGKIFYVLIVGIYETYDRAQEASESLPPPLDDVEVWIRPLGSLQQAMVRADDLAGSGL